MKANEAPEKLYLLPNGLISYCRTNEDDIEYTRTDAFIDKACEWLKEHKEHPLIGCEDPCLSGYLTDEFIEDFKKYMKE